MVDVKTQTKREDPRASRREARQRRLRLVSGGRPVTIKVWAANEEMREVLRHPHGIRFRDTLDEGVEWPNDSFTTRRIAEGSVRTDGAGSGNQAPEDESLNPREQSAARKSKPAERAGESNHKPSNKRQPESESQPAPQPAA
jgi:hypothetical protein